MCSVQIDDMLVNKLIVRTQSVNSDVLHKPDFMNIQGNPKDSNAAAYNR